MKKFGVVFVLLLVLALAFGILGCSGGEAGPTPIPTPEPTIPPDFTTYTDDATIYSISYPQDWEAPLSRLQDIEQAAKDLIDSINSNLPIGEVHVIFMAGLPVGGSWEPNINIVVEPLPSGSPKLDSVVDAEVRGLKSVATNYHEISRVKTTVAGREAVIVEFETDFASVGKVHDLIMVTVKGENIWVITCTTMSSEYSDFEDTLHDILYSFRIWK